MEFKLALTILGGMLALSVIAALALSTFDWNRIKPWLANTIGHAIDRSVTIDGDIDVTWQRDSELHGWRGLIPGPRASIGKVSIGNPDWLKAPIFMRADSVDVDLDVLPLLHHTVSIPSLRVVAPTAALERLADGRANWQFGAEDDTPSVWHLDLGNIHFDSGEFSLHDGERKLEIKVQVKALKKSIAFDDLVAAQERKSRGEAEALLGASSEKEFSEHATSHDQGEPRTHAATQQYAFSWTVTGKLAENSVSGSGDIGGALALKHADRPFPMHADVRVGPTRIAFVGTMTDPTDLDALNLRLWLSGNSLADLYDVLKITLPESPPYVTEGHLTGRFTGHEKKLRYENFTARVGSSDLRGDLKFETRSPRPLLSGKIDSETLQFRDLAPMIGAGSGAKREGSDSVARAADKVLPVEPFRPERWQKMDADVQFTGDRVFRDSELPIHKVDTRITMDNALLSLDPLKFRLAFGDVDGHLHLDGRSAPIKATFQMTARGMQAARFLPAAQSQGADLGLANADANLRASGDSVASLLGAAAGELKLVLDGGTISKGLIETIGLNLPNIAITKLFGDEKIDINCAAADLVAENGVFDAKLFVVDTDVASIDIGGKVDLANEKLDLSMHTNNKSVRLFSLRSPIHVRGTFKQPDVGIDKGALLARSAGAIALGLVAAPIAALLPLTATNFNNKDEGRCAGVLSAMAHPASDGKTPVKKSAPKGK